MYLHNFFKYREQIMNKHNILYFIYKDLNIAILIEKSKQKNFLSKIVNKTNFKQTHLSVTLYVYMSKSIRYLIDKDETYVPC